MTTTETVPVPDDVQPDQDDPDGVLRQEINGPGIYDGMPIDIYVSDPAPAADGGSLSHSGAMKLIPPKTPAHYDWWRTHEQPTKRIWDFGHVAHKAVLGVGHPVRVVEFDDWRKKAAQEEAKDARACGEVPLLAREAATIPEMVAAVRNHPDAGPLLDPARGIAERSFFWKHARTGRWCRSRPDFCPHSGARRFMLVDYKTAKHADTNSFGKASAEYGYHVQQAMALEAVRVLGLHPNPEMCFVVQEKEPPYLVAVHFLDYRSLLLGIRKFEQAVALFDRCTKSGQWPGYGGPILTSLPNWVLAQEGDLL